MSDKENEDFIDVLCQNCGKVSIRRHKKDLSFVYCGNCINEYKLTITKKSFLPKPIKKGHVYTIATEIEIRDAIDKQRDDGKVDIEYKAWQTGKAIIQNEHGRKMEVKDMTKQSPKLRCQIVDTNDSNMEDEAHYQYMMTKIRHFYIPYLKKYILELIDKEDRGVL